MIVDTDKIAHIFGIGTCKGCGIQFPRRRVHHWLCRTCYDFHRIAQNVAVNQRILLALGYKGKRP